MNIFLLLKSLPILGLGLLGAASLENQPVNPCAQIAVGQAVPEPTYSVRILKFVDQDVEGCLKMQLSIYATYTNDQVLLAHTAIIASGEGCANGTVLSRKNISTKSGSEYIVKDEQLHGPIEDFIASHPKLYPEIVLEKEKVMGILKKKI